MIEAGNRAPDFTLPDSEGKMVSLSEFRGKKVLLIFYPGDDTPVCTAQLCDYRNNVTAFTSRGIEVIGISGDSPESHKKFAEKHELPFLLLSDQQRTAAKAYDALGFLGMAQRAYVLIDEEGTVLLSYSDFLPVTYQPMKELLARIDEARA
jgi:peroxiredoxin